MAQSGKGSKGRGEASTPSSSSAKAARARQASGGQTTGRPWLMAVVVGALVILGVVAIALSAGGGSDGADPETAPVEVDEALPALPDGQADPAVGEPAPVMEGTAPDGSTVTIGDDGRAKIVVFLAHWCPHCQAEVPRLVQWMDAGNPPQNVDIYAVATATDPARGNHPPSEWLEREGWDAPVLLDDAESSALASSGMVSFPAFLFIDADHEVAGRYTGELPLTTLGELVGALT